MLKATESIWKNIARRINDFFFQKHLRDSLATATLMKERIDEILRYGNFRFKSKIEDASEMDWVDVRIDVYVSIANFNLLMNLWEAVEKAITPEFRGRRKHVFTRFEPIELWERK